MDYQIIVISEMHHDAKWKCTRAALLLRHLCVKSESRKYSTTMHYVSHS